MIYLLQQITLKSQIIGSFRLIHSIYDSNKPWKRRYVRTFIPEGKDSAYKRLRYRKRNRFYDFEELYPLSHFEVNLKEIYDKGTLSEECIDYARGLNIPPYQWTALDVKTMLRFISYSYEKRFTNEIIL